MATSRAKDLADFIAKQSTDDDSILETGALQLPAGTTAERPTAVAGMVRYNSTIGKAEQYDGVSWIAIDSPPVVSSVSPDNFDADGDTIVITGSNFSTSCTVSFINNSGTSFSPASTTRDSSSQLTVTVSSTMVSDDDDPYDVKVTNASGLSATLENALDFAPEPAFTVAAGTLATIYDSSRSSLSITTGATSDEADATITYAVTTGSLPSGLSISSSTGTITGSTSAVGSDTTTTFTITATATDTESNVTTNTRQYSIIQKAPVITSYTSVGSGTFTVPSGVSTLDVLVVAGGGSAGGDRCGGGGAGGLIFRPAFPVTPGGSVSYTVGQGGGPGTRISGQDSVFGTLTAKGGGGAGAGNTSQPGRLGQSGGSGGGGGSTGPANPGGTGTQPQQPGDSSTYGYGYPGGVGGAQASGMSNYGVAGGGGGAGAAGSDGQETPTYNKAGDGGNGRQYDISGSQVYYAGGGGAGGTYDPSRGAPGPKGGGNGGLGGGGDGSSAAQGWPGNAAVANRGGGAGGGGNGGSPPAGPGIGGSGIVIVKY